MIFQHLIFELTNALSVQQKLHNSDVTVT